MAIETHPPRAIRTVAVVTQAPPDGAGEGLRAAVEVAGAAGCTLLATPEELAKHSDVVGLERVDALPQDPDLCLVLGGDGTILSALRRYARTRVPVYGINYGTVGFLAAAEAEELRPALERAFAAEFNVLSMPGLEVAHETEIPLALNDVSFTRQPHGRVAELSYRLGDQEVGHVRCDGLVASTPAGSTGYNLANGGPILAWGVEGFAVSFVAPHTLTARALVVAPDDVLHVRNEGVRDPVELTLDGTHVGELLAGDGIDVTFSPGLARLAQLAGSTFYSRIREKFGRLAH
jgi:NAD+ kinase